MYEVFYTVKEVSEMLKVNPRTIQNYIRSGEMKAFKVGKDWRIPKIIFQDWVKRQIQNTPSDINTSEPGVID